MTQAHTARAVGYCGKYRVIVWWATHVEMTSGFMRLLRDKEISEAAALRAIHEAERLSCLWDVVEPAPKVALDARAVLQRYPLRAADALQLAAALAWCGGVLNERVFLTFDRRLAEAAGLAGFMLE